MKLRIMLPAAFLLAVMAGIAQPKLTQNVKGTITDADSKRPIADASIRLQSVTTGAVTDSLGYFLLNNVPLGRQTILVSRVGYEDRIVAEILISSVKSDTLFDFLVMLSISRLSEFK